MYKPGTYELKTYTIDRGLSFDELRKAMKAAIREADGLVVIPILNSLTTEERLLCHAYAEVYGAGMLDHWETSYWDSFTQEEWARLPELCAQIRERHRDAPRSRPANARPHSISMFKVRRSVPLEAQPDQKPRLGRPSLG